MTETSQFRKILGRREVLGIAFGAMIGWGWVVLSGEMINRAGTIGSILAFLLGSVMVALVGVIYGELTSALSRAGGELTFTFLGMGPAVSYFCGWTLVLAYFAVCSFEAVAIQTVTRYLLPALQYQYLYSIQGYDIYLTWVVVGAVAALAIGFVNYFGIKFSSFLQWSASLILLVIGLSFFLVGNITGDTANLAPHFKGWTGFFRVVMMTPFLFLGFDIIPQVSEEIKVPARQLGRLIMVSIIMATVWYVLVQWTVGISLTSEGLASDLPTAEAMKAAYRHPAAAYILVFGGLLGILTSWNAFFIGATRLIFAMGRAHMLPEIFSRLHPRYESPVAAIVLITVPSMFAPLFGRPALVWLADAGSFATVLAYLLVAAAFIAIRKKYPDLPRPYRVGYPRLVGGVGLTITILFALLYLPGSPGALIWPYEWLIFLIWSGIGVVLGLKMVLSMTDNKRQLQHEHILGKYAGMLHR